jgi:ribose transport system substrate-binding protein
MDAEDQQDFLEVWQKNKLTAISPTYPVYSGARRSSRPPISLSGKQVPKEWILPQPTITADNLAQYLRPGMPPLFYSTCGCQNMPGFPQDWGGK